MFRNIFSHQIKRHKLNTELVNITSHKSDKRTRTTSTLSFYDSCKSIKNKIKLHRISPSRIRTHFAKNENEFYTKKMSSDNLSFSNFPSGKRPEIKPQDNK